MQNSTTNFTEKKFDYFEVNLGNVINVNNSTLDSKSLKVISLDLDETLICATRIACNNTGGKALKYWGERVSQCREMECRKLLKNKPLDCELNDEEYLRAKYGPSLFEDDPDIASPFRWSFPVNDFSNCWILIRCHNEHHKITSFYRIEYRPYCQHLIEIINKYKKFYNVKVVVSTMATRQYGSLVCKGFKLFNGYYTSLNGNMTPLIDEFVGLEDWREKVWDRRCPRFYGKKSLAYIGSLFKIHPDLVVAIDDKPQIWTNSQQVIYALPYNGGVYFKNNHSTDNVDNSIQQHFNDNDNINEVHDMPTNNKTQHLQIDNILYKIAKYFESCLCDAPNLMSKSRFSEQISHKTQHVKFTSEFSNPLSSNKNYQNYHKNSTKQPDEESNLTKSASHCNHDIDQQNSQYRSCAICS